MYGREVKGMDRVVSAMAVSPGMNIVPQGLHNGEIHFILHFETLS